jgi:DNA ligase D-like protein (predicted polymerase)
MRKAHQAVLELAGREVVITNPDKPFFPQAGHTKLHLVRYYAAVAEGALRGIAGRPIVLKRYVDGAAGEPFFQKRAPEQRPEWIETVELRFPSGRTAREIVVRDAAQLLWMVNLGCIDLNPHPVRADDLEHPDELRVDLDPGPGVSWDFVRRVTLLVHDVLDEQGLRGWPKKRCRGPCYSGSYRRPRPARSGNSCCASGQKRTFKGFGQKKRRPQPPPIDSTR